jgi:hypothetical protein
MKLISMFAFSRSIDLMVYVSTCVKAQYFGLKEEMA